MAAESSAGGLVRTSSLTVLVILINDPPEPRDGALLTEVARRQRVLGQLSVVLSTDTALARNPHIRPDTIRVSAVQWALLIRVRHGSTPHDLAWDLSRSVFGTTIEAYRLLARQLLSVAGPRPEGPARTAPNRAWPPCRSSGRCPSRKVRQCPFPTLRQPREVPTDAGRAQEQTFSHRAGPERAPADQDPGGGRARQLVATSDGLVVAHDIPDVEPTQIAALAAATLAAARRATLATECGTFREAVARTTAPAARLVRPDPGRTRPPGSGGRRTRSPRTAPGDRSRPDLGPNGRRQSRTRRPTAPG